MEESLTLSAVTQTILIVYQTTCSGGSFDNLYLLICEAQESLFLRQISPLVQI
jgi:hypothetical protein